MNICFLCRLSIFLYFATGAAIGIYCTWGIGYFLVADIYFGAFGGMSGAALLALLIFIIIWVFTGKFIPSEFL